MSKSYSFTPCVQCGEITDLRPRCSSCERKFQARRNHSPQRAKYQSPIYRATKAISCNNDPLHEGPYEKHHISDIEWIGLCRECHHDITNDQLVTPWNEHQ